MHTVTRMRLDDQHPVFRKKIIPWYDSGYLCLLEILLMIGVFLFGMGGISVISEMPEYRAYLWVPGILLLLSGGVILSVVIRLIRRASIRRIKDRQ